MNNFYIKINFRLFFTILFFGLYSFEGLIAQDQNYKVVLLPPPPSDSTIEIPSELAILANEQGVFVGAKPENFNGKVLAIHSGLFSKPDSSVFVGEHYRFLYNEGYIVAFFATSGYKGDFYNGESMAKGIDAIVNHYKVDKISLVGFSNGGVASEIAMFLNDKSKYVDKVYTLGTPFYGFYFADILTLTTPIGMYPVMFIMQNILKTSPEGEELDMRGIVLSSTVYRQTILRPMIEESGKDRPADFHLALSKNYFDYSSTEIGDIFESTFMFVMGLTQNILFLTKNDGVTPYFSGKRPGAVLDEEFEDIGVHHNRLTGINSPVSLETLYKMLKKYEDKPSNYRSATLRNANSRNTDKAGRNIKFKSNFQSSTNGNFRLDSNSNNEATIFDFGEAIKIISEQNNQSLNANGGDMSMSAMRKGKPSKEEIYNRIVKKIDVANDMMTGFRISSKDGGQEDAKFLIQENIEASLEADYNRGIFDDKYNPYPTLLIDLKSLNGELIAKNKILVNATVSRISDLKGQPLEEESFELEFIYNPETDLLEAETLFQNDGVYSINIRLDHTDFRRDIIGGYSVGTLFESVILEEQTAENQNRSSLHFDSKNKKLHFELNGNKNLSKPYLVQIYESNGRIVSQGRILPEFSKNILTIGNEKINLNFKSGSYYFVSIDDGKNKYNHKILVK